MTVQERFVEASQQFMQALQAAWTPMDIQERGSLAYSQYLQALQEASVSDVQQRVAQAYAVYAQVVQEALQRPEIQEQVRAAYREYVRAVREAWLEVDVDSVDAALLAEISQSVLSSAWMAATAHGAATNAGTPQPAG
jgi:hypothetical protein